MNAKTKENLKSLGRMVVKAALGAALAAVSAGVTGLDFGPTGNLVALVVVQALVHAGEKFGLNK